MIFDNIKNKELYLNLHPGFKPAFEFIEKVMKEGAESGKYELDGKKVYAMVSEYEGKENHEKFEAHRKYIDIQFILSGEEILECTKPNMCTPMTDYDAEKDVEFLACNGLKTQLQAEIGDFAIFYPADIHKPAIKYGDCKSVKKIVVKVLTEQ